MIRDSITRISFSYLYPTLETAVYIVLHGILATYKKDRMAKNAMWQHTFTYQGGMVVWDKKSVGKFTTLQYSPCHPVYDVVFILYCNRRCFMESCEDPKPHCLSLPSEYWEFEFSGGARIYPHPPIKISFSANSQPYVVGTTTTSSYSHKFPHNILVREKYLKLHTRNFILLQMEIIGRKNVTACTLFRCKTILTT